MFEPIKVDSLRITDIGTDCLARLWFKLVYGPVPPRGAAVLGTAFHKAIEVGLKEVPKHNKPAPEDTVVDAFVTTFRQDSVDAQWNEGEKPEKVENEGILTTKAYHKHLYSFEVEKEEDIEYQFKFRLPSGRFLTGTIDLILPDRLVDHKTTGSNSLQSATGGMQSLGYQLPFNEPRLFVYSVISTKNQKHQAFPSKVTRFQVEEYKKQAERIMDALTAGLVIGNPSSYLCSPNWCGYWRLCPFGGREDE